MIYGDPTHVWIGANDIENEGNWKFISSDNDVTFTIWAPNQPITNERSENCVLIDRFSPHNNWYNKWNDVNCSLEFYSLCSYKIIEYECHSGWELFNNKCYKLISDDPKPYQNASKDCESLGSGGSLATMKTEDEYNYIKGI